MTDPSPALMGVNLIVKDMTAALTFYRRLGLTIPEDAIWSTGGQAHHVTVNMSGGVSIEFDSIALTRGYDAGWRAPSGPPRDILMFRLPSREDVDDLYRTLTVAGAGGHLAPFDAFWGARYGVVADPDGNHVGLMSPMDPQRGGPPPAL